jgi:hypothetical protein
MTPRFAWQSSNSGAMPPCDAGGVGVSERAPNQEERDDVSFRSGHKMGRSV